METVQERRPARSALPTKKRIAAPRAAQTPAIPFGRRRRLLRRSNGQRKTSFYLDTSELYEWRLHRLCRTIVLTLCITLLGGKVIHDHFVTEIAITLSR